MINQLDRQQYKEAVKIVMDAKQASVSLLQRRMRVGYSQAARLIDQMEEDKVISPYNGNNPRKILVKEVIWKDEV